MSSIQYTIRQIPQHVDEALRARAEREKKSINKVVLDVLESAVAEEGKPRVYHDLDHLIGSWVEDPYFDEVQKDFQRIDPEAWK